MPKMFTTSLGTADPNFKVVENQFDGSVGPVKIRLLTYDSHHGSWQPYIYCVKEV